MIDIGKTKEKCKHRRSMENKQITHINFVSTGHIWTSHKIPIVVVMLCRTYIGLVSKMIHITYMGNPCVTYMVHIGDPINNESKSTGPDFHC